MGLFAAKEMVSKAVVICGPHAEDLNPLIGDTPVCMLPVLNRPLIEHTVNVLEGCGIKTLIIALPRDDNSSAGRYREELIGRYSPGMEIRFDEEDRPKGTAGALRDLRRFIEDDNFFVIDANVFMEGMDFGAFLSGHKARGSVVTIGVKKDRVFPVEGITVGGGGTVKGFTVIHPSRERRSPYSPAGIYLFSPAALDFISEKGYFDIKEQLIPELNKASMPVHIHEVTGYLKAIVSIEAYFEVQRERLFGAAFDKGALVEVGDGVWVGADSTVSHRAYIVGPVIIGNGCDVAEGAQIIGPSVIGDGCVVGRRAVVRESILWRGVAAGEGSTLRHCVAGGGLKVYEGDSFSNKVLIHSLSPSDMSFIPSQYEFSGIVESVSLRMSGLRYLLYLGLKRMIDLFGGLVILFALAPVMAVIAFAIKRDSEGPCMFRQARCGKDGRDFVMYKFRTMVKDAAAMQQKYVKEKDVDGPVFKLLNDPRITRMGRFLRKTSLDELPQIFNVIKGEMSLVGPRPLVMDEMRFSPSWRSIRLKVKPGITGLWQVEGRSEAPFHDWIRYDVYYVKNQSLLLDIKILLKTVKVVFSKVGAY
jgi:lipopolysaccharide/colanic/teichoic acid biosynthesis glycosyltransferase/ADP-glucose pyrophosphorylase